MDLSTKQDDIDLLVTSNVTHTMNLVLLHDFLDLAGLPFGDVPTKVIRLILHLLPLTRFVLLDFPLLLSSFSDRNLTLITAGTAHIKV